MYTITYVNERYQVNAPISFLVIDCLTDGLWLDPMWRKECDAVQAFEQSIIKEVWG